MIELQVNILHSFFFQGQFIENQLPERVSIQAFMEDLLKMPPQYVDQVMYSLQMQQQHRVQSRLAEGTKDKRNEHTIGQRVGSNITSTTRSTTSNSNHS